MRCDFGGSSVLAHVGIASNFMSHREVRCTSPELPIASTVVLRFMPTDTTPVDGSTQYRFYDPPEVRELRPSGGPVLGGTLVLVLGAGFGPYAELRRFAKCRFTNVLSPGGGGALGVAVGGFAGPDSSPSTQYSGEVTTPATVLHQGALRCRSPPFGSTGGSRVEVSLNGVDFSASSPELHFSPFDNWVAPLVGGSRPSTRGGHAFARLGGSLWMHGGFGGTLPPGPLPRSRAAWGEGGARGGELGGEWAHGQHEARLGDTYELRVGLEGHHFPSETAPALAWRLVLPTALASPPPHNGSAWSLGALYSAQRAVSAASSNDAASDAASDAAGDGGSWAAGVPAWLAPPAEGELSALPADAPLRAALAAAEFSLTAAGHELAHANASAPLAVVELPTARSGHTLTPVGGRLLMYGGEADAAIERPIAERFMVQVGRFDPVDLRRRSPRGGDYVPTPVERYDDGTLVDPANVPPEGEYEWEAAAAEGMYATKDLYSMGHPRQDAVRQERPDLGDADTAVHAGSDTYVQSSVTLGDVHSFDAVSQSWLALRPLGTPAPPRTGHAACAVGHSLFVFGGWRLRECAGATPCGESLNDLAVLRLHDDAPPHWLAPAVDGAPPSPRHGHSFTWVPSVATVDGGVGGAIVLFGGQTFVVNVTTGEGVGRYLNDVHVLVPANLTWATLALQGSPPSPRASHAAVLAPSGHQLIIYAGRDGSGAHADLHVLDTRRGLWWQLYASGAYPRARHSVGAALLGSAVVFFGGRPAHATAKESVRLLHTHRWELRTTATIGAHLASDGELNASCALRLGTAGSPSQVWSCGERLRERQADAAADDAGEDYA